MATFINQVKNAISPSQVKKIVGGGYSFARYGMSKYGQGGLQFTNLDKTLSHSIWAVSTFPWQETSPWTLVGGAIGWFNKIKN